LKSPRVEALNMTSFEIQSIPFNDGAISVWSEADPKRSNWPIVYSIDNDREIYIGETLNAAARLGQHLSTKERQHLKRVRILLDETFNKSVCLDLESHLIRYFHGDGKYKVLNKNSGITDADYFNRDQYRKQFESIYEKLLEEGLFTKTIPEIVNSNLFKYSPFKALTSDQQLAVDQILRNLFESDGQTIVVKGEPGTGKTIVAVYIAKLLSDIKSSQADDDLVEDEIFAHYFTESYRQLLTNYKIGFVIPQQSLRKTIQHVFRNTPGLDHKMVMTQFEAGDTDEHFDLLIVDEAHRLQRRANQPSASLNTKYKTINEKLFGEDRDEITQLDWILKKSDHQILLLDKNQRVKPADLDDRSIDEVVSKAETNGSIFSLKSQMRVKAGSGYINFIKDLISGEKPKPIDFGDYDFRIFDNLGEMRDEILKRDDEHGLSRLVAGYAWDWVSKTDPTKPDIAVDGVELFWNRSAVDWVNSPTSREEVGSIHTIQGYDLNYAGVIIGKDIGYDEKTGRVFFRRENYFDKKGKENNPRLGIEFSDRDLLGYVLNVYRVLLTRGVLGTYVYIEDPHLEAVIKDAN
jgi:DUF2075 family protein